MFAFLLMEEMTPFYENIGSYPTLLFSIMIGAAFFYWLVAVMGLVDMDFLDIDLPDADADLGQINFMSGLLLKFGLNRVPLTISLTFLSLYGWMICYTLVHFFVNPIAPGVWNALASTAALIVSLMSSLFLTSSSVRPLKKFFNQENHNTVKKILGQVLIVRTSRVDEKFGEATLDDGAAGLILKVRSHNKELFKKGDRVVPFEYNTEQNAYLVISETEFFGKHLQS